MVFVFALVWSLAGSTTSQPLYFIDINRCLYFKSKIHNKDAYVDGVRTQMKAHCEPRWVNKTSPIVKGE